MKVTVEQITRNVSVNVTTNNVSLRRPKDNINVSVKSQNVTVSQDINNVKVGVNQDIVQLSRPKREIQVNQVGRRGPTGKDGRIQEITAGPGLIIDNTDPSNPVLSATGGSGDKNFVYDFTMQHTLNINHGLQKYPSVTVLNSAGDKMEATVQYVNINTIVVEFTAPFSGRITLN